MESLLSALLSATGYGLGAGIAIILGVATLRWWWVRAPVHPPSIQTTPPGAQAPGAAAPPAGGIAPNPAVQPAATPTRNWKPVAWIMAAILILIAGTVLAMRGYPGMIGQGLSIILGVAAAVALLYLTVKAFVLLTGVAGTALVKSYSDKFGKEVITSLLVLLAVYWAFWSLNPKSDLFTTPEGWTHLVAYAVLITIATMAYTNLSGARKFAAAVGMLIVFLVIGFETKTLYDPDGKVLAKLFPSFGGSGASPVTSATVSRCDEHLSGPIAVSASPTFITTSIKCLMAFDVVSGKVIVEGEGTGYIVVSPAGIIEDKRGPGWRGTTIRSLEAGTQITRRFFPSS
jgi:hypothetical protein